MSRSESDDDFIVSKPANSKRRRVSKTESPTEKFMMEKGFRKEANSTYSGKFSNLDDFESFFGEIVRSIEVFTHADYYKRSLHRSDGECNAKTVQNIGGAQFTFCVPVQRVLTRTMCCGHDGHIKKTTKSQGKRRSFGSKKMNCRSFIKGTHLQSVNNKTFAVIQCNLNHETHEPFGTTQHMSPVVNDLVRLYHKECRGQISAPQISYKLTCDLPILLGDYNAENRAHTPTRRDIENLLYKLNKTQGGTKEDQKHLNELCRELQDDNHHVFYQPYNDRQGQQTKFNFVFLHKEMKSILEIFGSRVLVDATYKTCRYRFNLFHLMVKTPQRYMVVAFFITQDELHSTIEFCLEKIKEWSPKWAPIVFLIDQDASEILAIKTVFPDANIFLCDFHIKMDWMRKFKSIGEVAGNALFDSMRKCIYADTPNPTEDVTRDYYLQKSIDEVLESDVVKKNPEIESYIRRYMESKEMWAECYRSDAPTGGIRTTNGIEGFHSNLKKYYLNRPSILVTTLVSQLVRGVMNDTLVDYYEKVRLSSKNHRTIKEHPELSDCSKEIYSHLKARLEEAKTLKFLKKGDGVYWCRSSKIEFVYEVTMTAAKVWCTCPDFKQHRLPCKHLFSVAGGKWESFPLPYRNAIEFNSSEQIKAGTNCRSVVHITEEMTEKPLDGIEKEVQLLPQAEIALEVDDPCCSSSLPNPPQVEPISDLTADEIPSRSQINKELKIKRLRKQMLGQWKTINSALHEMPEEYVEEVAQEIKLFAASVLQKSLRQPTVQCSEFCDPTTIESRQRGRPSKKGKEKKRFQ